MFQNLCEGHFSRSGLSAFFVVSLGLGFATRGDVESSPKYENLKGLRAENGWCLLDRGIKTENGLKLKKC